MVDAATKERARELRRAGASLREIGRAIGVSHVTVRQWTKEEPVSPASGGKDVADGVGLQAGTTPNPRKMLDGLISTWSGRAETDRFAASLIERLLRQREALDAQDETRRDGCAYHLEANMIIELLVDLELYVRLEVTKNLHAQQTRWANPPLSTEDREQVERQLATCDERIGWLFNNRGQKIPGHVNYQGANAAGYMQPLNERDALERAEIRASLEKTRRGE